MSKALTKHLGWNLNNVFKHWKQLIYAITYIVKRYCYNMKKQKRKKLITENKYGIVFKAEVSLLPEVTQIDKVHWGTVSKRR